MKSNTNQLDSKGVTECGSKNTAFYQVDCGNTAYTYHGILLILWIYSTYLTINYIKANYTVTVKNKYLFIYIIGQSFI